MDVYNLIWKNLTFELFHVDKNETIFLLIMNEQTVCQANSLNHQHHLIYFTVYMIVFLNNIRRFRVKLYYLYCNFYF